MVFGGIDSAFKSKAAQFIHEREHFDLKLSFLLN